MGSGARQPVMWALLGLRSDSMGCLFIVYCSSYMNKVDKRIGCN